MPRLLEVASGRRRELVVYGDDYPTSDGTGLRDYIHVMDLAEGHVAALRALSRRPGCEALNLGTGRAHTVNEVIRAFRAVSGVELPVRRGPRREGDLAGGWADPTRAQQVLGWRATRSMTEMCRDAWCWTASHPSGYRS
jgi:UDP-glucose 4-epimerase